MSKEHQPTGGEGITPDGGPSVTDDRQMTDADLDKLFEVLADERRRRVIAYLDEAERDVAEFSELVDHVADDRVGESSDERERIAVSLHHNHLPKLVNAGIAEYDNRSRTVRYRGGEVVSEWIELARSHVTDARTT